MSQVEHELFGIIKKNLRYFNLFMEEWTAIIKSLADDRPIVDKRHSDSNVYRDVSNCKNSKNILHIIKTFIKKINKIDSIPKNAIFMLADVVGLHSSIPHEVSLITLREALIKEMWNYFQGKTIENDRGCA